MQYRVNSEDIPKYLNNANKVGFDQKALDDQVINDALRILESRVKAPMAYFASPRSVKDFLRLHLRDLEHEVFGVMWLNSQHTLIEMEEMFRGTLTQTSVYPREVVKEAIKRNAASVVLYHNHPSGTPTPSRADEALTQTLKSALALVDVRVLDHLVVTASQVASMAELGLM